MVTPAGLGDPDYALAFCIANRPALDHYPALERIAPLAPGELQHIVANSSNHWRKLFSVYAKCLYALGPASHWPSRWQDYRDKHLLQAGSGCALLFTPPAGGERLHIVAGKTYAAALGLNQLEWLDAHFAIDVAHRQIVTPYLDYRQLSNERIERLAELIRRHGLATSVNARLRSRVESAD
ncbi:DUF6942 family protein [Gilvimarinus algae]|uniref:Uncharacterized protein n=1 Tax=Gilvimarinus algae TaxID=3058037 RepID=A0ABT8TFL2_9GAMM|nr:hypothetical protein [Gilvimarinus sp. SDUM040014]MDO3381102.1 hypothetical protein [Gilvimarinus sp. SDUM040014]